MSENKTIILQESYLSGESGLLKNKKVVNIALLHRLQIN